MAYTEKLLPVEALMAAWQNRRQSELQDNSGAKEREQIQNDLLKEQLEAAKWQNLVSKERPTITLPAGPGLGGMREKQFLDQQAGYISGTNPADVFNQWQQNFRSGMSAGGGGGGGGSAVNPNDFEPGSSYTYGQNEANRQGQLSQAQADMAGAQARQGEQIQSGYGTAARDALANKMVEAQIGKVNDRAYDDIIKGARDESKSRWQDINAGDKMIANTKSIGNEMKSEIDATARDEAAAGNAEVGRDILRKTLIEKSTIYPKKSADDKEWGDRALAKYEKYHKQFYSLRGREPRAGEIDSFLTDNVM